MTHIRDPIQELLIIVRRNQILDTVTNVFAEKGDHSNPGANRLFGMVSCVRKTLSNSFSMRVKDTSRPRSTTRRCAKFTESGPTCTAHAAQQSTGNSRVEQ